MIPIHIPVLVEEILEQFHKIGKEEILFLDGTAGEGGHSEKILVEFPKSKLILLDRDPIMLERAMTRLEQFKNRIIPLNKNFSEFSIDDIPPNAQTIDGILLDLGISTYHIKSSERGFSFQENSVLDMRLNGEGDLDARKVVNKYPKEKLLKIFLEYGEENWSKKIVEVLVSERRRKRIETTQDLNKIVEMSIPRKFWPEKVHPAFRIFQAIRIEVNQELKHIEVGLNNLKNFLSKNGIFAVISFHSLEDRIVKNIWKELSKTNEFQILTPKPIAASETEIAKNLASRSAKLRVLQKL
ncbi:MAG: 16S rRNA (cytosine(1402)-N(4))-methyltransferase RsmH [Leptospiraceae bacterium]|nr:16S rRNA (cytosine(1402)-N(4))-methyltransferase RsmH [Leptospiraceae bacterium]